MNSSNNNYVVITPAQNEEEYIEATIQSLVGQTVLPKLWVIVSDGSTDRTEEIVEKYIPDNQWITLVKLPKRKERNFAAKVLAVREGEKHLKDINYNYICNLDADIRFGKDFFEYLLNKLDENSSLGIAGTDYTEGGFHSFRDSYISASHVNGQCQVFRRRCWEDIGGYTPIKGGGIDTIAVRKARMKGWLTRSFQDRTFEHLKPMGTAGGNVITSRYKAGRKDYILGGHPLWHLFRSVFNLPRKPYIIGGGALFLGFFVSWITGKRIPISNDLIQFHRAEQMSRLKEIVFLGNKGRQDNIKE